LCEKIASCEGDENPVELIETCHKKFVCQLPEGSALTLVNPSLRLEDFERVLAPFLDTDMLFTRETEYSQTLSIFVPIEDALDRSNLKPDQIDLCLLAGGSCLIPNVRDVLAATFDNARILSFESADAMQTAVAKGAALNALSLAIQDRPIIRPV
jgi:hypothetical protein